MEALLKALVPKVEAVDVKMDNLDKRVERTGTQATNKFNELLNKYKPLLNAVNATNNTQTAALVAQDAKIAQQTTRIDQMALDFALTRRISTVGLATTFQLNQLRGVPAQMNRLAHDLARVQRESADNLAALNMLRNTPKLPSDAWVGLFKSAKWSKEQVEEAGGSYGGSGLHRRLRELTENVQCESIHGAS